MSAEARYQNIYGRRAGRGLRPWLIIPKYICAAVFLGGLVSLLVLGFLQPPPADKNEWMRQAEVIRQAYMRVTVPALIGALIMGVLLICVHPGVFLRMRWLQAKLALIVTLVPTFHLFMSGRSAALSQAIAHEDFATAALRRGQLFGGTIAAIIFAILVIVLGRLKPRLRQNFARTFSRS